MASILRPQLRSSGPDRTLLVYATMGRRSRGLPQRTATTCFFSWWHVYSRSIQRLGTSKRLQIHRFEKHWIPTNVLLSEAKANYKATNLKGSCGCDGLKHLPPNLCPLWIGGYERERVQGSSLSPNWPYSWLVGSRVTAISWSKGMGIWSAHVVLGSCTTGSTWTRMKGCDSGEHVMWFCSTPWSLDLLAP